MKFIINLAKNYIVVYKKRERRQMPKTLLLSKCFHNGIILIVICFKIRYKSSNIFASMQ